MKKFGLIAALFACIFGFAACENETDEKEEITSFEYSIEGYPLSRCYDIYVFEKNKDKEVINTRKIFEMYLTSQRHDVETFNVSSAVEYLDIYFQRTDDQGQHSYEKMTDECVSPIRSKIALGGKKITKEEYEFYTNRP